MNAAMMQSMAANGMTDQSAPLSAFRRCEQFQIGMQHHRTKGIGREYDIESSLGQKAEMAEKDEWQNESAG